MTYIVNHRSAELLKKITCFYLRNLLKNLRTALLEIICTKMQLFNQNRFLIMLTALSKAKRVFVTAPTICKLKET